MGGLSVLREVGRQLPHEDVIYLADSARVPYGSRSPEEIITINEEIIPLLIERGAKLIIIACGTSSALAYPVLKDLYPVELVGLIEPGAAAAAAHSHNGRLGLIATAGTVNSGAYRQALLQLNNKFQVFSQACPLFVPLVEGGFTETAEAKKTAQGYLTPLLQEKIDTLILGCTHYPHLAKVLGETAGPGVSLVDPAEAAVALAKKMLLKAGTLRNSGQPRYEYLVTGDVAQFQTIGSRLLGRPISHPRHVII